MFLIIVKFPLAPLCERGEEGIRFKGPHKRNLPLVGEVGQILDGAIIT